MKVTLYYDDINVKTEYHKTLRITLPKSWKTGPTIKLLQQFVESYNSSNSLFNEMNPLSLEQLHLEIRQQEQIKSSSLSASSSSSSYNYYTSSLTTNGTTTTPTLSESTTICSVTPGFTLLASDANVIDVIQDRCDIFVRHGPSMTIEQIKSISGGDRSLKQISTNTIQCTRFGCMKRFPKGGPYPSNCIYHKSPPVFHETAKFWSCCPHKKAYDFDEFQKIPGCQTADYCTDIKEANNKSGGATFLGGMDLREKNNNGATKLKSIDDFNKEIQEEGCGDDGMVTLNRLQSILFELDIDKELYQQVLDGIKKDVMNDNNNNNNQQQQLDDDGMTKEMYEMIQMKMGQIIKDALKKKAAEQLRIK